MTSVSKSILIILIPFFILSCGEDEALFDCNSGFAPFHPEIREMYPYKEGLKTIVFSDSSNTEFNFDVIEYRNEIVELISPGDDPLQEWFVYKLHSEELDIHLRISFTAVSNETDCPDSFEWSNRINISGPLQNVPISNPLQSNLKIIMSIDDEKPMIPDPNLGDFAIHGLSFNEVYQGSAGGPLSIFFNFEFGVVGLINNDTGESWKYERAINQ